MTFSSLIADGCSLIIYGELLNLPNNVFHRFGEFGGQFVIIGITDKIEESII
jgi:hypothetical protein